MKKKLPCANKNKQPINQKKLDKGDVLPKEEGYAA